MSRSIQRFDQEFSGNHCHFIHSFLFKIVILISNALVPCVFSSEIFLDIDL